jgi:hypothetical protein
LIHWEPLGIIDILIARDPAVDGLAQLVRELDERLGLGELIAQIQVSRSIKKFSVTFQNGSVS